MDRPLLIDIEPAGKLLQLKRTEAYNSARKGGLPVVQMGPRRYRVPVAKLAEQLGVTVEEIWRRLDEQDTVRGISA